MRVAIIGTVGVPACYGGFETLAENLVGEYCSDNIEYTVFCSSKMYDKKLDKYHHARLKYIPFRANDIQCIPYDIISLLRCLRGYDIILYLGVSVPILKMLKRICKGKVVANIDGISKNRDKYSKYHKFYLEYLTRNKIIAPDAIISDNWGIQQYAKDEYGRDSYLIAYGGDQALVNLTEDEQNDILDSYGLHSKDYAISVCRIEPENNCHITLEAFATTNKPLVFIGNWNKNEYGRKLKEQYGRSPNIKLIEPVYDLKILYSLRNNACLYIHGHKVGGTNPSLVEAMFFGIPILCFDVVYNRSTTFNEADYYSSLDELIALIADHKASGETLRKIAFENYTWKHIVHQYEEMYKDVLGIK